jgi:hypothetical protein
MAFFIFRELIGLPLLLGPFTSCLALGNDAHTLL